METNLNSNTKTVRLAASLFFFISLPMAIWSETYVPSKIFVSQNPVATAENLLANEFIFRTSIVGHVAGYMLFVFMLLLFYRVFRPVDKHLALLMILPALAQVPVVFIAEGLHFTALMTLKSDPRGTFDAARQHEVSYFLMRMYRYTMSPTKFFLGLSFIPFGMLIMRSGLAPRVIGILVVISGVSYVADSCCLFLLERANYQMIGPILRSMFIGFAVALVWFMIKGIRDITQKEHVIDKSNAMSHT
ncbi:MAG: DUF4386 domain-containing protein [Bacteroidota bacterium]